jgi:hypothetical protein
MENPARFHRGRGPKQVIFRMTKITSHTLADAAQVDPRKLTPQERAQPWLKKSISTKTI